MYGHNRTERSSSRTNGCYVPNFNLQTRVDFANKYAALERDIGSTVTRLLHQRGYSATDVARAVQPQMNGLNLATTIMYVSNLTHGAVRIPTRDCDAERRKIAAERMLTILQYLGADNAPIIKQLKKLTSQ